MTTLLLEADRHMSSSMPLTNSHHHYYVSPVYIPQHISLLQGTDSQQLLMRLSPVPQQGVVWCHLVFLFWSTDKTGDKVEGPPLYRTCGGLSSCSHISILQTRAAYQTDWPYVSQRHFPPKKTHLPFTLIQLCQTCYC